MLLIERLRRALASEYTVEREIAGGGMGVVFAARQLRLDRRVAIKVLRPERATAVAAERFLAEGRVLARLSDPAIVPVFDAGEADGLLYYVMEFVEGETLAERLAQGPLDSASAHHVSLDLLGALAAAHHLGIVHRDVKPQNIILRGGHALLGDFGIAHWREAANPALTITGQLIGTPQYMSPEQRNGEPTTCRSDVYAAGMILFEVRSGQRWPSYQPPDQGDWSKVPREWTEPIRRALELSPDARWPDAGAFASALGRRRRPGSLLLVAAIALAAVISGRALINRPAPLGSYSGALPIVISRFPTSGPSGTVALADSVAATIRGYLSGFPDFDVHADPGSTDSGSVRVTGGITSTPARVRIFLTAAGGSGPSFPPIELEDSAPPGEWKTVANRLAVRLLRRLWERDAGTDVWLPLNALPRTPEGFNLWYQAERLLGEARWEEASKAYVLAERADSDCYLCSYRSLDVDRWLARSPDSVLIARLRRGITRFPPHYQSLIRAAFTPLPARIDSLSNAARTWPSFSLAWFEYGDELLHRGPLYGHPRTEALAPLIQAVLLRPRFGPGWEHLTWLYLSEGSRSLAGSALESLSRSPVDSTGFSMMLRMFLTLGYQWRYLPPDSARVFSGWILSRPAVQLSRDAVAGARLLMTADAPRGAVEFGKRLTTAWPGRGDAVREGLLGQLFGYAALGRLDSVRLTGQRLDRDVSDPALPLLALELEALLRAFDPDSSVRSAPGLLAALDRYLGPGAQSPELQRRAAWGSGLLASRSGDSVRARAARSILANGPDALRRILAAAARSQRGDAEGALRELPLLPGLEEEKEYDDPLAYAAMRFVRAESQEHLGDRAAARGTLIWLEHLHTRGHGTGDPQPGEMGWAMGTLGRWKLAGLLDPATALKDWCSAERAVARLWEGGEPPFAARADSARRAARSRQCGL